jgi:hypothetical protein
MTITMSSALTASSGVSRVSLAGMIAAALGLITPVQGKAPSSNSSLDYRRDDARIAE